ncbi:MAG: radical SAM protein [Desulfobacterota bacterium]|nr:radical SAM protein [Thermodesulfobacteriota bacterium]MDW8002172.1 radical SAM protein [Deltaproteobacteria bacterium]
MARYVFGPVPSRRLGISLGVDVVPWKYCNFDCIYCQVGKTTNKRIERTPFFDKEDIVREIEEQLKRSSKIDYITFSGSGEPTLNADLGWLIREVKKLTSIPVAVITNGSFLFHEEVRGELMEADVVLPSLDAASEDIFRYVNRPHMDIELEAIIEGLRLFSKDYKGKLWLEVMMIKYVNDEPDELEKLKAVIDTLSVDKIQLNTVVRPPAEHFVEGIQREDLEKIREFFGEKCEIICSFEKAISLDEKDKWEEKIIEILKRRPLTLEDVSKMTGIPIRQAKAQLKILEKRGSIRSYCLENMVYYFFREA